MKNNSLSDTFGVMEHNHVQRKKGVCDSYWETFTWAVNIKMIIRSDINKTKVRGVIVETVMDGTAVKLMWECKTTEQINTIKT